MPERESDMNTHRRLSANVLKASSQCCSCSGVRLSNRLGSQWQEHILWPAQVKCSFSLFGARIVTPCLWIQICDNRLRSSVIRSRSCLNSNPPVEIDKSMTGRRVSAHSSMSWPPSPSDKNHPIKLLNANNLKRHRKAPTRTFRSPDLRTFNSLK